MTRALVASLASVVLSACTLMPHYQRPRSPVPDRWPSDAHATASGMAPSANTAGREPAAHAPVVGSSPTGIPADQIGWHEFFTDPRLRRLIEIALENNRNLRIAVLNVAASQAQFRVQRGVLFPSISATGSELVQKFPSNGAFSLGGLGGGTGSNLAIPTGARSSTFRYFNAGIGFTNYELDLFGRERSLTTEAFEQYLAQNESRRSTQISLVGEVATDYFAVLSDLALVKLTQDTLRTDTESYELTKAMYDHDTTTLLALRQSESVVDAARTSLAQYQRQLAEDVHALTLVVGQELPADLPQGKDIEQTNLLASLPAGLPSALLARRPDILSAEHALRAANANIGAARAAFFPSIQLTASGGSATNRLSSLFGKGTGTWSFNPTITLPIFTGGQNRANLDLSHIERNIAIARYELTIQTAFREVSDALSARGTYVEQLGSQEALVAADADAYRLAQMRFRQGVDSYLSTLDAQRSLYSAQQTLVALRE
ncbi:MAG TPA: efflux transporter outer membrane subunit, partial [Steroidobacteraceae bacterium]